MYIEKVKYKRLKQELLNIINNLMSISSEFIKIELDEKEKEEFEKNQTHGKLLLFPGMQNIKAALTLNEDKGESEMPYLKEGTIKHRTDGRWEIRYYDNEKKRHSIYAKTQKECLKKFNIALEHKRNGEPHSVTTIKEIEPIKKPTYTIYSWLQFWYDNFKSPQGFNISKSQLTSIEICMRKHICGNIADKPIEQLTSLDIQQTLNKIESSKMRKETRNTFSDAMRTAYMQRVIKENPMDFVQGVKHVSVVGKPLSAEEQKEFISKLPQDIYGKYFKFMILCGARPSEILNTKWEHVDFEKKSIILPGTKTKKSLRILPLFAPLEKLLKTIEHTNEYIFTLKLTEVEEMFKTICPQHRLYDLRHTFATRCLENNVPMKVVQVWLGHSKYNTTANTYSHVLDEYSVQQATKLYEHFDPFFDT